MNAIENIALVCMCMGIAGMVFCAAAGILTVIEEARYTKTKRRFK